MSVDVRYTVGGYMTGARRRQINARMVGLLSEAKIRSGLSSETLAERIGVTGRCIRQRKKDSSMYGLSVEQALDILDLAGYAVEIKWNG